MDTVTQSTNVLDCWAEDAVLAEFEYQRRIDDLDNLIASYRCLLSAALNRCHRLMQILRQEHRQRDPRGGHPDYSVWYADRWIEAQLMRQSRRERSR